jgi:hypothetical protein
MAGALASRFSPADKALSARSMTARGDTLRMQA